MSEFETKLRDLFEFADTLPHPQNQSVRRNVKTIAAESGLTPLAVEFAGVISNGVASKGATRQPGAPRFNTTPPSNTAVFVDPNLSAAAGHAAVAAIEEQIEKEDLAEEFGEDPDATSVDAVYAGIAKQSPNDIAKKYGEGPILGMIEKLGGDSAKAEGLKLNQKAAYLQQLIKDRETSAK